MNRPTKTQGRGRFFRGGAAAMFLTMAAAGCGGGAGTIGQTGSSALPPLAGSGPVSDTSSGTDRVLPASAGPRSLPAAAPRSLPAAATVSAAATGSVSLVYVADAANNAIYIYNNVPSANPVGMITTGINSPQGITFDSSGNLYVANEGANDVLVFAPGSPTPSRTYTQALTRPSDVAVSTTGDLYVTNEQGGNVVQYPAGSTTPSNTWQLPVANAQTLGVALGNPAGGDAYVSYVSPSGGGVLECPYMDTTCYATNISVPEAYALAPQYSTSPLTLFVSDIVNDVVDVFQLRHGKTPSAQIHTSGTPFGVALDPTFTHLYVTHQTATGGQLTEYAYPGGTQLTSFLPPKSAKPAQLTGIALGANAAIKAPSKIYVANTNGNTVTTYNLDGSPSTPTITGLHGPKGIAVDAAGKIYVANSYGNSVTTYNPDGTPSTPTITTGPPPTGPYGGAQDPVGVAVDASGKIHVSVSDNSVRTYNPDGTPSTIPTIEVPETAADGLAVDAAGNLYITNEIPSTVTKYNAKGVQITPTISAGLNGPTCVAVDPAGKIYVSNLNGTLTTYTSSGTQTTPTISGLNGVTCATVDATGKIYVTSANDTVTTYNPNGTPSAPTITTGITPAGIAIH